MNRRTFLATIAGGLLERVVVLLAAGVRLLLRLVDLVVEAIEALLELVAGVLELVLGVGRVLGHGDCLRWDAAVSAGDSRCPGG